MIASAPICTELDFVTIRDIIFIIMMIIIINMSIIIIVVVVVVAVIIIIIIIITKINEAGDTFGVIVTTERRLKPQDA